MFKVGDKVKVIEENLSYGNTNQHKFIKDFIGENNFIFLVTNIFKNKTFPIEIAKLNGEKMLFLEKELEKVEE